MKFAQHPHLYDMNVKNRPENRKYEEIIKKQKKQNWKKINIRTAHSVIFITHMFIIQLVCECACAHKYRSRVN